MTKESPNDVSARHIDFDEVARLIGALEHDLTKVEGNSRDLQRLRDEIETLKNVLRSPVRRPHWVRDALHGIRERIDDRLDAAVGEGLEVGRHMAEIGRILGM